MVLRAVSVQYLRTLNPMEFVMAARFNVVFSDDLNRELDKAVDEDENSKADVLRKALQLYLAARDGKRRGLKLGLIHPETQRLETEIVGL
jgi:metal-responsive CopG/Arc/MetJ family transcriptional regulator